MSCIFYSRLWTNPHNPPCIPTLIVVDHPATAPSSFTSLYNTLTLLFHHNYVPMCTTIIGIAPPRSPLTLVVVSLQPSQHRISALLCRTSENKTLKTNNNRRVCTYCGRNSDTINICYKKHEYPPSYKFNNGKSN